jgi:hypothetical protein
MNRGVAKVVECYEVLAELNRAFADAVTAIDHLAGLHLIEDASVAKTRTTVEYARARLNTVIMEGLQEIEQDQTDRLDQQRRRFEQQSHDPDDVLLVSAQRRAEIASDIKRLKAVLHSRPWPVKQRQH